MTIHYRHQIDVAAYSHRLALNHCHIRFGSHTNANSLDAEYLIFIRSNGARELQVVVRIEYPQLLS